MDDREIYIENANGNSHLKWAAMLQPAVHPDGVLLKFPRLSVVWLPDQALIEGSPDEVGKLLADNLEVAEGQ